VLIHLFIISPSQLVSSQKKLFDSDEVMNITLKGNLRDLLNDNTATNKKFPLTFSCFNADSSEIQIPVQIRPRGHFRRMKENCSYPPLLIEFAKDGAHLNSVFKEQRKLKLVMPCQGDEYVIREWLVYKLYNLITPESFRVRLVKVKLEDNKNRRTTNPFYGILLEEEMQMAKRNNAIAIEKKIQPQQLQVSEFLSLCVFQYLIGNTDWSVQYQQNIKLIANDPMAIPVAVPYDFDHAGIVNAPYANPAEELLMKSIRERRYRGYCINDLNVFEEIISKYNLLKNDIYKLYTSCIFINAKYIKTTTQYLDDFFATINNPKAWQKEFSYPCDKNGTGNVVIKGLKED
jgi:hypothetical protein